jgi:hypothetical protein
MPNIARGGAGAGRPQLLSGSQQQTNAQLLTPMGVAEGGLTSRPFVPQRAQPQRAPSLQTFQQQQVGDYGVIPVRGKF